MHVQETVRGTVEADDVSEHSPHGRPCEIAAIGEQRPEVGRPIGEDRPRAPEVAVGDTETHLGVLHRNRQLGEKTAQVGIVPIVVHDETGIDRNGSLHRVVDGDRVRVAPEPSVSLEDSDVMARAEHVGTAQPGNT